MPARTAGGTLQGSEEKTNERQFGACCREEAALAAFQASVDTASRPRLWGGGLAVFSDFRIDVASVRAASEGRDMREEDPQLPDFAAMTDHKIAEWILQGDKTFRSMVVMAYFFGSNKAESHEQK